MQHSALCHSVSCLVLLKEAFLQEKKMQQPILGQILIFFHFYDCAIANASLLSRIFSGFFRLRQSFRADPTITIPV